MKHRNSHFAVGYWSRIRQGRCAPDQSDVDPKALKRLLPFVFLLDTREDGSFIYRLAGTTLCERYGSELRGKDFLAHWDPDSRTRLSLLLHQSLASRTPVCLTSVGATEDCRMVEIETVLMPITFGTDEPQRFLAIAQVLTDVAPLSGCSITFERLVSSSLVREHENSFDNDVPPPPPPPFEEKTLRYHPRAPHLRLVVSHCDAAPEAHKHAHMPASMKAVPHDPLHFDAKDALRKIFAFCGAVQSHADQAKSR